MNPSGLFADPDFVRRTLTGYTQQFTGLAALFARPGGLGVTGLDALRSPLAEAYRQLFSGPASQAFEKADAGADAFVRWQRAYERFGEFAGEAANDAFVRLVRALAEESPPASPVTSVAALHALWIDCGEAAWAEVAHRDEFAEAQAELLAALAGLRARAAPA